MTSLVDDDTLPFGLDQQNNKNLLPHPYVTLSHVGFRSAALVSYLLCGWFSDSFITSFVVIVLLLSVDFWTVKNVTGRLMVGLRWWNYIDDEGKSHWVYESRKDTDQTINPTEMKIFWAGLICFPVIWGLLFIAELFTFKFKWLMLVCIAATLNGANLHGYLKCRFGKNNENIGTSISNVTSNFFRQQVIQNMTNLMNSSTSPQPTVPQINPNQNIV